jgi:TolA-binding protein
MFESAQAARRAGQSNLALRRFVELMRAFPRSEQAHNARVEHFRLLRSLGKYAEARQSAQAYLRSHPRGFAAAEARRLVD